MKTDQTIPVIAVSTFGHNGNTGVDFDHKANAAMFGKYRVTDRIAKIIGTGVLEVRPWERIQPLTMCLLSHISGVVASYIYLGAFDRLEIEGKYEPAVALATTNPLAVLLVPLRIINSLHAAAAIEPDRAYFHALEPFMTCDFIGDPFPPINEMWRPWHILKGTTNAVH